jgi:hypothetical protein
MWVGGGLVGVGLLVVVGRGSLLKVRLVTWGGSEKMEIRKIAEIRNDVLIIFFLTNFLNHNCLNYLFFIPLINIYGLTTKTIEISDYDTFHYLNIYFIINKMII